ncbi:tRNA lysidine(34) synthetase TilS [Lentilactobacillus sp. SPB1-3]|uniref:tRNA lysidine(34) synthetase TilS n=1 Tax=Lentilactobacillus terminaliae TaxID=3003483 RepID=A0ACD5DG85_9LACO|nr:tRNA lysidine(34) synthetase TilS [Lentilactobacillus sp. SPB1-3]MCZ0977906.1 tRNA lysidine(34) synthetase TilS [Lentilactobacillus sp. SPB1-3]
MVLINQFSKNIQEHHWFDEKKTLVLAVSTGVDSMTMLDLFLNAKINGLRIIVAYVDHQLRESSVGETKFIKEYCAQKSIDLRIGVWPIQDHPHNGVEAAARQFRYDFFANIMSEFNADYLATAHHADDLAETMIMKLVRGGRLDSLVGILPERTFGKGKLIRPMLSFSKSTIRQYAVEKRLKWFEDETNATDENLRNRIRHNIMPQLKKENALTIEHMADYSQQIAKLLSVNNRYLDSLLDQAEDSKFHLSIDRVLDFDSDTRLMLIQRWLELRAPMISISSEQLQQIDQLLSNSRKSQGEVDLINQLRVVKSYQKLCILDKSQKSLPNYQKNADFMVPLNRWNEMKNGHSFGVFTQMPANIDTGTKIHELSLSSTDLPLKCRSPKPGDRFQIESGGHQKVARLLINQKVTNEERELVKLLVSNEGNVLAVLGYRVAKINGHQGTNKYYLLEK